MRFTLLILLTMIAGCARQTAYPVRWTDEVKVKDIAPATLAALLNQPVDDGQGGGPLTMVDEGVDRPIATAAEFLDARDKGWDFKTNYDNKHASWFKAVAFPVRFLQQAKTSRQTHVKDLQLNTGAVAWLPSDVGLILSGDDEAAAKGKTVSKCWPKATVSVDGKDLTFNDLEGGMTSISIVAWGDLNGDDVEDMLLSVANYATGGSLCVYRYVTVTRLTADGPVTVLADWY